MRQAPENTESEPTEGSHDVDGLLFIEKRGMLNVQAKLSWQRPKAHNSHIHWQLILHD